MRRRPVLALAWLLLAGLACGQEPPEPEATGAPVTVSSVVASDLVDRIEASGQLLAKEQASIAAEVGGRVTELLIDEGAAVQEGEVVLAIDPERRNLELESARARCDEADAALAEQQREVARIRELHERNVASQTQLDQTETQLKLSRSRALAAQAELGVLQRALRDASVKAPFAGLIAERFVSRGEFVTPGQKLFELVSLDPIEVEFHVTEIDSSRVQVDQRVDVRLAPFPDATFAATVTVVSPTIDPSTRTLRVKALLDNHDGRLRPGLFARVDLGVANRAGVAMIPEEAILQRVDGAVVFRVGDDQQVQRRVIETGVHQAGLVEVVNGLALGDVIVSRGHRDLVEGQRVDPRNPDGSRAELPLANVAEGPASAP